MRSIRLTQLFQWGWPVVEASALHFAGFQIVFLHDPRFPPVSFRQAGREGVHRSYGDSPKPTGNSRAAKRQRQPCVCVCLCVVCYARTVLK